MKRPGTIYEAIGGYDTVDALVTHFYARVGKHPCLIPIFPEDLTETARKQRKFLTQFFGGPSLYNEEFGSPMMRRRHLPFEITPTRKDAWLECMNQALRETNIQEPFRTAIFDKLTLTAHHMMNTPE